MRGIKTIFLSLTCVALVNFQIEAQDFSISTGANYLYQSDQNYTDVSIWSNGGISYNYNISETLSLFIDSAVSTEYHLLTGETDSVVSLHTETTYRNEPFFIGINLNPYLKVSLPSKVISGELEISIPMSLDFFTLAIFLTPRTTLDFEGSDFKGITLTSTDYSIQGGSSFIILDQLLLKPSVETGINSQLTSQTIYIQPQIDLSWFSTSIFSFNATLSYKLSESDQLLTEQILFTPQLTYYLARNGITITTEIENIYTEKTQASHTLEINPSINLDYQLTPRATVTLKNTLFNTFTTDYSTPTITVSAVPFISLSLRYLF